MVLDAPTERDEVIDEDGLTVVISKLDRRRIADFRVDVMDDALVATAVQT